MKNKFFKRIMICIFIGSLVIVPINLSSCSLSEAIKGQGSTSAEVKSEKVTINSNSIKELYYYDKSRAKRYKAYQKKYPKMKPEEVIWRVDADLDKPLYNQTKTIAKKDENSITQEVNKHFLFRVGYKPKKLVTLKGEYLATPETVKAFNTMNKAAKKANVTLDVCSAYRSIARQTTLYKNYVAQDGKKKADTYSARPRSSEHHTGRAIDLISPGGLLDNFEKTAGCKWVHQNGYKYGFILRYPKGETDVTGYMYESWHITYVGKKAAKTMHDKKIKTLEEYWVKYVKYKKI